VIVWDPMVERPLHILTEHTDAVYSVTFGREAMKGTGRLITCGHDKKIIVWDSNSGELIGESDRYHGSWTMAAAIDSSNTRLATVSMDQKKSLVIWRSLAPTPPQLQWVERMMRRWKKLKACFGK